MNATQHPKPDPRSPIFDPSFSIRYLNRVDYINYLSCCCKDVCDMKCDHAGGQSNWGGTYGDRTRRVKRPSEKSRAM